MLNEVRRVFSDFNLRKLDDYLFSFLHFRVEIDLFPGNDDKQTPLNVTFLLTSPHKHPERQDIQKTHAIWLFKIKASFINEIRQSTLVENDACKSYVPITNLCPLILIIKSITFVLSLMQSIPFELWTQIQDFRLLFYIMKHTRRAVIILCALRIWIVHVRF